MTQNRPEQANLTFKKMLAEVDQGHPVRKPLYQDLEKYFEGKQVVTFFTSFRFPVMIEDNDADMIEEVLLNLDMSKGLVLFLNSPGGSPLAAERIIRICRKYSNNNFDVVVPNMAKSAATMICFGANKIWVGPTSELGPIDPQTIINLPDGRQKMMSVHTVVNSYKELFGRAEKTTGKLEPYLMQLNRYDERDIKDMEAAIRLSEDIAISSLQNGMLKGKGKKEIQRLLKIFLDPEITKTHGRPIYCEQARKAKLNIECVEINGNLWEAI